jgi:hypothetical protein
MAARFGHERNVVTVKANVIWRRASLRSIICDGRICDEKKLIFITDCCARVAAGPGGVAAARPS